MKLNKLVSPILLLIFLLSFSTEKTFGQVFPTLECERVNAPTQTIPLQNKKLTLICVAFSNKASDDLNTWLSPVYNKFIAKKGMMDDMYDVNLHFVAAFSGATKAFKGEFIKKVEKHGDKDLIPYILMADKDDFVSNTSFNIKSKELPYFFIVDASGKILYSTSGAFSQSKMDAIESIVIEHL